uniref:CAAX prenyl protease 2/Lysostaphin resistance protein A-like domain-containing protein n=1 Tax=Aegilops tauschii TaxID=37682 RepID=M8C4Z4_AEGTA
MVLAAAASAPSLQDLTCLILKVFRASATKNNERKRRRFRNLSKGPALIAGEVSPGNGENPTTVLDLNVDGDATSDAKTAGAPRSAVLQSCTLTSGLLLALGLLLRETWPDFRDSSEAANTQILTSLESLDYIVVACLPGISEEFLFRGALMPIFGLNWISALATGVFFGVLHLGNGRRYSFAIWATFVGLAYGLATIASSSIIVPMASHSINNIIGGLLWRFRDSSDREM